MPGERLAQLEKVVDGLRPRFAQAATLLADAAEELGDGAIFHHLTGRYPTSASQSVASPQPIPRSTPDVSGPKTPSMDGAGSWTGVPPSLVNDRSHASAMPRPCGSRGSPNLGTVYGLHRIATCSPPACVQRQQLA